MHFDLNLATRYYLDRRKVALAFICSGLLLAGLLVACVITLSSSVGNAAKMSREIEELDKRIGGTAGKVPEKDLKELFARIKAVNSIINRKAVNWVGLLDRLEVMLPEGVMVMALEPDVGKEELKLTLLTGNFQLLRKSLERLEESGFFREVFLLTQNDMAITDSRKAVSFSVVCRLDYRKL